MNESALVEQVLRIINSNYSNIYVADINADKVYIFDFNVANRLYIKNSITYTDFIDLASKFVHKDDIKGYFNALSLNQLENSFEKGESETKVKYRKLCETGEYRFYINIINYLPFEGKKLIFMMSEDINDRLVDIEEDNIKLSTEVSNIKTRINKENESIGSAIYQINNLLESTNDSKIFQTKDAKQYINSIFKNISIEHPELNQVIKDKMVNLGDYKKQTILIVDDSSIIRNSLKRIFDTDYEILMAKDGLEAINIITNNVLNNTVGSDNLIVGILLDLVMPKADGFQVLDFLKKFNLFNKIPVAIISGDETRDTRKKVYEYDIVDMLEKPFNTDTIRRRIGKIINLYLSSNNLQNIIENQNKKLDEAVSEDDMLSLKNIINNIVLNIRKSDYSIRLQKMVKSIGEYIKNNYPKYNIDSKYLDALVNNCVLYNIGSIAMDDKVVITSQTIKQEIDYGLTIIDTIIDDEYESVVAKNIINYTFEMYNGSGYPNSISGNNIPIEAQITNVAVRLISEKKSVSATIKSIIDTENNKYNPDVIETLKNIKKDIKNM